MTVEIIVKISGFCLSLLMAENEQANHQIGLLMGHVNEECLKTVTDADMASIRIKKYVNVTGSFPINVEIFDHVGQINIENLQENMVGNLKNIVGWYRFRRNTNIKLTVREKLIHKNLCNYVEMPVDTFIFGALIANYSTNNAIHKYQQLFYRYDYTKFIEVPLTIPNLGEPYYSYKYASKSTENSSISKIIKESTDPTSNENSLTQLKKGVTNHINHLLNEWNKVNQQIKTIENTEPRLDDDSNRIQNKTSEEINEKLSKKNSVNTPIANKNPINRLNRAGSNSSPVTSSPATSVTPDKRRGHKRLIASAGINTRPRRTNKSKSINLSDED